LALEVGKTDVVRGRQHGEHVAAVAAQYDRLGETLARDMASLGGACGRHRGVVRHHLVGDDAVQMSLECRSDGHNGPPCDARARIHEGLSAGRRLTMRGRWLWLVSYARFERTSIG